MTMQPPNPPSRPYGEARNVIMYGVGRSKKLLYRRVTLPSKCANASDWVSSKAYGPASGWRAWNPIGVLPEQVWIRVCHFRFDPWAERHAEVFDLFDERGQAVRVDMF